MLRLFYIGLAFLTLTFAKPYRGGELRTLQDYRYGRFEVRMKSAAGDGVISSFFTLDENFKSLLDKISNAKVSKEFPAKIAVNSLNFL